MSITDSKNNLEENRENEILKLMEESPSLSREDVEYLQICKEWYGHNTWVWI